MTHNPSTPAGVLFDVEGVIAHPDPAAAERLLSAMDLDLAAVTRARNTDATYPLWERYSIGRLAPADYWAAVARALGRTDDAETVAGLRRAQRAAWWACIDDAVLAIVDELRSTAAREDRALRIGLLSNSAPEHEAYIGRFAGHFDAACFSHRTGLRKPDPAAYRLAAAAIELPMEATAFVDDKTRNTDAARALGMAAIPFTDAAALRVSLAGLGLLAR